MDFGRAFTFPFSDQDWPKKILIPALIALIPIIGSFYVSGWMIEIVRRVLRNDPTPLPDDVDFGKYLIDGLKLFVIGLVWSIPLIIMILPGIPTFIAAVNGSSDSATGALSLLWLCCCGLGVLYMFFLLFIFPAVYAVFAQSGEISSGFRFNEILGLVRAAPGAYVMVVLGYFVVGLITSVASAVPYIGTMIASTYGQAAIAHLSAQAYQQARGMSTGGFTQVYPS
jgi:hypothetical protein